MPQTTPITPFELLSLITSKPADTKIGTTIAQALHATFGDKATPGEYAAAGIICTLFLSSILEGFPTAKLHTFVRNYREENPLFSFDCKSYDTILSNIGTHKLLLMDKESNYKEREIEKQDFMESFDFFTNQ